MKSEVLRFLRTQGMLCGGERVICAVSGGADSMALLGCLCLLREELSLTVEAAHFNHRLRGAESDADEAFVRQFCARQDIPLTVSSADVAARRQRGQSLEDAAREARYGFFDRLSCDRLATAHTADDNAETVLINLLRGTGLSGLAGIPPVRGRIIRPLLCATRRQVLTFLEEQHIPWREDSSNTADDYLRNRLRHHVLPLLRAENPRLAETMLSESLRLRAEHDHLSRETDAALARASREGGWDCAVLAQLPDALQRRALHAALGCGASHVEQARALLLRPGRLSLPGGHEAVSAGGLLRLRTADAVPEIPETRLLPGQTLALSAHGLIIRAFFAENIADFSQSGNTFLLNYDMIEAPITVRSRRSGDTLRTDAGRRSLKRLMIDRKIPAEIRGALPVLAAGDAVLAAVRIGVSREFLPAAGCRTLVVTVRQQNEEKEEYCEHATGH